MATMVKATRLAPRAMFSASSRPLPPDFAVRAALEATRLRRAAKSPTGAAPAARWAQPFLSLLARLAGVRRSASVALTLMLASGIGDDVDDQTVQCTTS